MPGKVNLYIYASVVSSKTILKLAPNKSESEHFPFSRYVNTDSGRIGCPYDLIQPFPTRYQLTGVTKQ